MIQFSEGDKRLEIQPETYAQLLQFVSQAPEQIAMRLVWTHEKMFAMTRELFQSEVTIKQESDLEVGEQYFRVSATATGEVEEIVKLQSRWHELAGEIAGSLAGIYCLSLDVK